MHFFNSIKMDLLKEFRSKLTEQHMKIRYRKIFVRNHIIYARIYKLLKNLQRNWKIGQDKLFWVIKKYLGGKRLLRGFQYAISKRGPNPKIRHQTLIRHSYQFFSNFSKFRLLDHSKSAEIIMKLFLHDKNRIRQLILKARQFYVRMLNIQTKWKNVYSI